MAQSVVPEVRKTDPDSGTLYLRDGVTFTLFFGEPDAAVAKGLEFAFDTFLDMVPPEALRWASVGANSEEWKPFTKTTVSRCKALIALPAMKKRDLTSFEIADGKEADDAAGYGFTALVTSDLSDEPTEKNLLQMQFPSSVLETDAVGTFLESIDSIAKRMPFSSGYCSPGLHWSGSFTSEALVAARKLANRYPGFDVQYNELGRDDIGDKVRGARWITFLGSKILDELGGLEKLRAKLPAPILVREINKGAVVRASPAPEIGDVNRQEKTASLDKVAAALEPVTQFGELVLLRYPFADDDEQFLRRWERRFLKG